MSAEPLLNVIFALSIFVCSDNLVFADQSTPQDAGMPPLAPAISQSTDETQSIENLGDLENRFFYHVYKNEPLDKRLDRLERLVYGKQRNGTLNERVARLMQDVPRLPAVSSPSFSPSPDGTGAAEAASSGTEDESRFSPPATGLSLAQEVSDMEKEVFGKADASSPLVDRVTRLEDTVFAGETKQTFTPLTTRINRLIAALQPQFNAPPNYFAGAPAMSGFKTSYQNAPAAGSNESKKKDPGHPIIHKLGKILGGIGTIAGETLGGVAAGTVMGYGYGGYGFGYPFGYPAYYGWGPRPFMGSYWW